jgi:iron(III) transport system ATP-binding protein
MGTLMTEMLKLDSLSLAYDGQLVVKDACLEIGAGEIVALLGPSGCGKSSILRCIAGFLAPQSGELSLYGKTLTPNHPAEKRGLGMVFQDFALFSHLNVQQNIAFGLHGRGDTKGRVDGLIERFGLGDLAHRLPAELSGGQQQRTGLARALAPSPKLLLLDEPFANLDAQRRKDLGSWTRAQLKAEGAAALLVTHDRSEAMALADRIAVMHGSPGELLQTGSAKELFERPQHSAVARQMGELLIVAGRASGRQVRCELGEFELCEERQGSVQLLLQAENIELQENPKGALRLEHSFFAAGCWQHSLSYDGQSVQVASAQRLEAARCDINARAPLWAL